MPEPEGGSSPRGRTDGRAGWPVICITLGPTPRSRSPAAGVPAAVGPCRRRTRCCRPRSNIAGAGFPGLVSPLPDTLLYFGCAILGWTVLFYILQGAVFLAGCCYFAGRGTLPSVRQPRPGVGWTGGCSS